MQVQDQVNAFSVAEIDSRPISLQQEDDEGPPVDVGNSSRDIFPTLSQDGSMAEPPLSNDDKEAELTETVKKEHLSGDENEPVEEPDCHRDEGLKDVSDALSEQGGNLQPVDACNNTPLLQANSIDAPQEGSDNKDPVFMEAAVVTLNSSTESLEESQNTEEKTAEKKWYCRPFYLGLFVALAFLLIGSVIAVVIVLNQPKAPSPEQAVCNILGQPSLTQCKKTRTFFTTQSMPASTIPTEIGLLTQLTQVYFNYDVWFGTIPSEIGLLTQLVFLSFWSASLTGTIPASLGSLTLLTSLDFTSTGVTGAIPSTLENLSLLKELYFTDTQLTGSIPTQLLEAFTNLDYVSFYDTLFTGTVPTSVCARGTDILINCNGTIECSCCQDYVSDDDSVPNPNCP